MTDKQKYWVRDVGGVYAQVEGADQRDEWTRVRGWTEAEPGPTDQVHVVNSNPGITPGRLPYAAVEHWAGLGWEFGPPEPVAAEAVVDVEPVKTSKSAPAGVEQKEK